MAPNEKPHVLAEVSTKGRLHTTLPLTIAAVAQQTRKPERFLIFNDGEPEDLSADPLYQVLFALLDCQGIAWELRSGQQKGQHWNHQQALMEATELIWRLDDDEVPEPDTLARLLGHMTPGVGAVAPLVRDPKEQRPLPGLASARIEDILFAPNIQWYRQDGTLREADHLFSTFLYRKKAGIKSGGYCLELSPAAYREETLLTLAIKRAGFSLLVDTSAVTWHLKYPQGGVRSHQAGEYWRKDELLFRQKLEGWGIRLKKAKLVVLNNSPDDHLAFCEVLAEIKAAHPQAHLIVAAAHPEILPEDGLQLIPLSEADLLTPDPEQFNIYRHLKFSPDWKEKRKEIYRRMYL